MKRIILCIITFFLLLSCASAPLDISENDHKLRMIGGKEALLDAIVYPDFALRKGIEGIVTVMAYVDTAGMVRHCQVINGNEYLNDAAINALKQQRFYPYILDGQKRPVRVAIPISFMISKEIDIVRFDMERVLSTSEFYMNEPVVTLSDHLSERTPGTVRSYYSEGISWWPNPDDPDGPYIFRSGKTNPDAFREHADLLKEEGRIISGLTAAYLVSNKEAFARKAVEHLRAWFITPDTRMESHLKHAQAIPGRNLGRDTGILEGLPLVEILGSVPILSPFMKEEERSALVEWVKAYGTYLTDDSKGKTVRTRRDNYSLAWLLQLSAVAELLNDRNLLNECRDYYEQILLPEMTIYNSPYMDSSQNLGIPFNVFMGTDMLAATACLLDDGTFNAWTLTTGRGQRAGDLINYLYSAVLNHDLTTSGTYDGRYLSLLFAGKAYDNLRYLELFRDLQVSENEQDWPLEQAVIWLK